MRLEKILQNLGLTEAEAGIYRASLELGQALPKHIADKANIKRPTLYKLLPELLSKGLLSETIIGKRRYLVAEDPEEYLEKKQAELAQMESFLPELRSILASATSKPKITFYQGIEGLKKVYMDNLRQRGEVLEFLGLEKIHPDMEFAFSNYYIPQRIKRKISIKIILSGNPRSSRIHLKTDPYALREVRVVDGNIFPIPLDAYVYGDNVSLLVYRSDSEPVGLIIRSKEIATFMRTLFALTWSSI